MHSQKWQVLSKGTKESKTSRHMGCQICWEFAKEDHNHEVFITRTQQKVHIDSLNYQNLKSDMHFKTNKST